MHLNFQQNMLQYLVAKHKNRSSWIKGKPGVKNNLKFTETVEANQVSAKNLLYVLSRATFSYKICYVTVKKGKKNVYFNSPWITGDKYNNHGVQRVSSPHI